MGKWEVGEPEPSLCYGLCAGWYPLHVPSPRQGVPVLPTAPCCPTASAVWTRVLTGVKNLTHRLAVSHVAEPLRSVVPCLAPQGCFSEHQSQTSRCPHLLWQEPSEGWSASVLAKRCHCFVCHLLLTQQGCPKPHLWTTDAFTGHLCLGVGRVLGSP